MRLPLLPLIFFIVLNFLVDTYIYRVCRRRFRSALPSRIQLWSSVALWIMLIVTLSLPRRGADDASLLTVMWMLFGYLSVYGAKYIFVLIDLCGRIPQLFRKKRSKAFSVAATTLSVLTFGIMWWGALVNRFNIDVNEIDVEIEGLPAEFDGYRILQFSDIHTGTYGKDNDFLDKLATEINEQGADVILFTGDIVNSRSSELTPHLPTLSRLQAPDGVYAILGNHDYGDYADWKSPEAKKKNREYLRQSITGMGWRLLLNETEMIRRGTDSIALIGVENIGDPPFPVYGSLAKAYPSLGDKVTKILLTHNPAHWVDSISGRTDINIPLTLSGHTHAMQIEVAGMSPAVFRYKTWGGLYDDSPGKHQLYVNIGIGTVGFPARIGATPEITVFTLRNKDSQPKHQ
ncbi:MAG: metallophosphoesterase [Muribaculaceae bacterium]|nr:metallophosphoesterase [Muribaculaceae bacterium]